MVFLRRGCNFLNIVVGKKNFTKFCSQKYNENVFFRPFLKKVSKSKKIEKNRDKIESGREIGIKSG